MGGDSLLPKFLGVGRRAAYYFLLLVLANLIMYALVNYAPGNPFQSAVGSEDLEAAMRAEFNLDRPFMTRFGLWFSSALLLDFGPSLSIQLGRPVTEMVAWPFVYTVLTVGAALILAFVGGVVVSASLRPDGPLGAALRPLVIVWSAIPAYLLCYWTIQGINRVVHSWITEGVMATPEWFPLPQTETGVVPYALAAVVLAVGDATLGDLLRGVDRELAVLSGRRYIHSARARGASIIRHGAAEFSVFVTGVFASRLVFLLGGVVVVEMLFSLSGAGALLWEAAEQRDYTVVMGVSYLSTLVVIAALFASDLYQFLVDPRVSS